MFISLKKIFPTIILLAGSSCLFGQDVNEIMQHYFDTVSGGSINNWRKIKTAYVESTGYFNDPSLNVGSTHPPSMMESKTNYHRAFREWPDKLKTQIYEDSTYQILLSSNLWKDEKLVMKFRNGPPIIKQWPHVKWDFMPVVIHNLLKNSEEKKFIGIKNFEDDGITCFVIELVTEGQTTNLYFNRNTYLLEYMKILNPSDSNNYTRYYDYKLIDGFLIHASSYGTRNGVITNAMKKTKILFNIPIDQHVFEPD